MNQSGNKAESPASLKPAYAYPVLIRWCWKVLLRIRFHLFHRNRYDRLVIESLAGYPMMVLPQVFNPVLLRTGEFMARILEGDRIPEGASVLDLGCGSGTGSIASAKRAEKVTAVDINPEAVRCTKINAALNNVEDKVRALQSDLFDALEGERFDVILFNPPFYRGKATSKLDHAWRGEETLERFANELRDHLTADGEALVVFSSHGDVDGLLAACDAADLHVELETTWDLINEIVILYRVVPEIAEAT